MPATFTEVLPARTSSPHSAITWTPGREPGTGLLTIATRRDFCEYLVCEMGIQWDGRAFLLAKVTPGTDSESASYAVYVGRNGQDHSCCCKGHVYGNGKPCRHVLAVKALLENGWADLTGDDAAPTTETAPF